EGIEAVEGAEHALYQAAALGRGGIGIGQTGEALGQRRRAGHGNGAPGLGGGGPREPPAGAPNGEGGDHDAAPLGPVGAAARRGIRGTQRGKLTAAMRLGDFGKYFHQIGQAGAAWLGFEASRGLYRDLSYHNAAALWLYRRVEMGYHAASRRHALAAFGAD